MGLSLSVLVALVLLLPGAAFVFAATRLHSTAAPSTGLEQQLSLSLAVALVAAIGGHLSLLAILHVASNIWPVVHKPDLLAVIQLLGGNTNAAATLTAEAISEHPFCVGSYVLAAAGMMWSVGRRANKYIQTRDSADWYQLLRPAEAGFVVLTAQFTFGGETVLFKGVVLEFRTSRTGALERVVLAIAARKTTSRNVQRPIGNEEGAELGHGWIEIQGEVVVLQMQEAQTIHLDYLWEAVEPPAAVRTNSNTESAEVPSGVCS